MAAITITAQPERASPALMASCERLKHKKWNISVIGYMFYCSVGI
jgi:hypothetical protein